MTATLTIAALWIAFAATHVGLSSESTRPRLVARVGTAGYQGLYALVALAIFVPLVWIYLGHRHQGPVLWTSVGPYAVAKHLNFLLMGIAFALLVCSFLPSGTGVRAFLPGARYEVRGILPITRHPMNVAFGLFGLAHLLVNGFASDVAFFAGWPLFAYLGSVHQDRRLARDKVGYHDMMRQTSIVPFAALLGRRVAIRAGDLPWIGIAAGLALAVLTRTHHAAILAAITPS
ncbi:MAG: hypothetical protein KC466_14890 [Myxococcales bacterium]|nr:hypothetical protein [Myxococcales bacterium]